jgi:signal transduction histidine kinase
MRRFFHRSLLWLLPAVLIPLVGLATLQYGFLRQMEQKEASAQRNWLRNSLEKVTEEIESQYRVSTARALTIDPPLLADVNRLGDHFAQNRVPGGRTFFAVRFNRHMNEAGYWDASGREKIPTEAELEAVKMSTVAWHFVYRNERLVQQPALQVDERDPTHRVILRPITDPSMHLVGVTGVVLDEGVSKAAMGQIGRGVVKARGRELVNLRVSDRFPKMPGGRDWVTQPIGFVFTNWRVGIRDACSSPEEIAAHNFRVNMMWTGSGMFVLLIACVLAIQAVARQAKLSQMKSDFVSNVSHELRTPLASIRVFGEYMRLGRVTKAEKIQQYGEYIEAESRRLTQLINNILDFSKIESEEKKYRVCDVDVVELVEQTVAGLEMPLRDQGFTFSFQALAHPPLLRIDKDALGQVLVNLIDNAVKYSGERKEIDVVIEQTGREVRIGVRDRGIGIAHNEQKKIFEKFYRVGSGLVHDVKGSGLGLAIVQHVVKAHGGRVEVGSMPGEGSTFTIVLPVPDAKALDTSSAALQLGEKEA